MIQTLAGRRLPYLATAMLETIDKSVHNVEVEGLNLAGIAQQRRLVQDNRMFVAR